MESVEAVSPVEVSKCVEVAGSCNDAEELARQMFLDSDLEALQRRETSRESLKKQGTVKQVHGLKGALTPRGPSPLEAMEAITAEHRRLWEKVKKKLVAGLCKRDLNKGLEQLKV
ncbi:MAG: hypothetical protein ACE5EZ_02125, partial [Thermodesulfobacteriota bacterium]